jgi:hypothetical protein
MKYRKKPVVVEAVQWTGKNMVEVFAFVGTAEICNDFLENFIEIPTLEGTMRANENDWIIKGVKGEFYPCKPEIFELTYYPVDDKQEEK